MKKLHLLALVIALCATAQAQWTTVTASHIYGGASAVQSGNNLLSAGTITFQGTDNTGKLIGYQVGGIGQQVNWPFICQITTGAIAANCKVPDTSQTNPVDICLSITIKNSNGQILVGGSPNSGYQCAQPFGATWNFDTFIPYAAGWPLASFRIATIGTAGIAQAPNCLSQGSGYYPQSLDSSGNWICTPVSVTAGVQSFNGRTGPVILIGSDIPNNGANTYGNAATATLAGSFATVPSQCLVSGQFSTGIQSNGNANCATPAGGGTLVPFGSPTSGQLSVWHNGTSLANGDLSGDVHTNGTTAATVVAINGVSLTGLSTGILKNTIGTGQPSIAVASDFPVLNQNTSGNSATATTAISLASTPVQCLVAGQFSTGIQASGNANCATPAGGGTLVPFGSPALGQLSTWHNGTSLTNGDLSGDVYTSGTTATTVVAINGVNLAGLATGILKNTITTGHPSIAVASDFPTLNQSTTGNAATSTTAISLASTPSQCTGTQFAQGIAANGNANCATPTGNLTPFGSPVLGNLAIWHSGTVITNGNLSGDVQTSGSTAATVIAINGVNLSGLATGILKNTNSTGHPSIAIASDFPTLNQGTTGNAATATALASSPSQCSGAQFSTGINASGNANCATPTGTLAPFGSPVLGNLSVWHSGTSLTGGDLSGDVHTSGSTAATVVALNGVTLSGLVTGILKNTTGTGNPSIAVASDFPTLNQNTTGTAAKATAAASAGTECSVGQASRGVDASWNAKDCFTPSGSGTINSGTAGYGTYYPATGTAVSGSPSVLFNTSTGNLEQLATEVVATGFPGATLVAQINNALAVSSNVLIPAGTYSMSGCSGWTSNAQAGDPWTPFYVGVLLPTGAHVHGAGKALTVINVTRLSTDPTCTLFANTTRSGTGNNPNITIDNLTINYTDQTTADSSSEILEIVGADRFTMHDVELSGNPNHLLGVMDVTRVSIHDNNFLLNTTSGVLGNVAISLARFQSSTPYISNAGNIYGNQIIDTGDPSLGASLVILGQSNVTFGPDNVIDLINYTSVSNPNGLSGGSIETGDDNDGNIEGYLHIHGNYFIGGVSRLALNNSDYSDNTHYSGFGILGVYPGTPDATTAGRLSIHNNTLWCPGAGVNCGIGISGNNTQGMPAVRVTDNTVEDGGITLRNSDSTSGGAPNCIVENNRVYNTPNNFMSTNGGALVANGCSTVSGNLVENANADSPDSDASEPFISIGPSSTSVATTFDDVSYNRAIDNQTKYSTGTVCSVVSPSSTTCLTSGSSRYLYSAGATWSQAWTNRYIFIGATFYMIRSFYGPHYIEFETSYPFIASGTSYALNYSMNIAYYLGSPIINFTNNFGYVAKGYMRGYPNYGMVADVSGTVIQNLSGNKFLSAQQAVISTTGPGNYSYYNDAPAPVGGVSCTQANCASSATTLYTIPNIASVNALYRAAVSIGCTSSTSTATAYVTISYTDVSGTVQSPVSTTATCTTLGPFSVGTLRLPFMAQSNSVIQYRVTTANSPQYQTRVTVFQESTN